MDLNFSESTIFASAYPERIVKTTTSCLMRGRLKELKIRVTGKYFR
jgi:hypothetical protein